MNCFIVLVRTMTDDVPVAVFEDAGNAARFCEEIMTHHRDKRVVHPDVKGAFKAMSPQADRLDIFKEMSELGVVEVIGGRISQYINVFTIARSA